MFVAFAFLLCLQEDKPVPVEKKWVDSDSQIDKTEALRIADKESWREFWNRHDHYHKAPDVDFGKFMVVAYLRRTGGHINAQLLDVRETEDAIRLILSETGPQVMGDPGQHTTYIIAVLPRSAKKIEFVKRHHEGNLKGAPIVDTVIKTLEGLSKK